MERINYTKVKHPEAIDERKLVIGLIKSTEFIKRIRELWNIQYIESSTAKLICSWCIEYYDKYKLAPNKYFEELFYRKLKNEKRDPALMEELECDILPSLSKQCEEEDFNFQFWIDGAITLFRRRHFELHAEQLSDLMSQALLDEADKLAKEFKPLEINITDDLDQHIQTVEQMESSETSRPKLLIYPWLREGETTIIYGDYGTGKSLLAIQIAYLSGVRESDSSECKVGEWQIERKTGCLYIDGELGRSDVIDRLIQFEWLGEQIGSLKTKVLTLPEFQLETGNLFYLSKRENQLRIINWLKNHPRYKLLIIDSISTVFELDDENSNSEWNKKINPFIRDLRALKVATIILHHANKSGQLRGASAEGAMAHNIFKLTNHPSKNMDDGEAWFTLTKDKQRSAGRGFRSFSLHFTQDFNKTKTKWEVIESGRKKGKDELNDKDKSIISLLAEGCSGKEISDKVGCSEGTVTNAKSRFIQKGYLTKDKKLTPAGKKLINERSTLNHDREE